MPSSLLSKFGACTGSQGVQLLNAGPGTTRRSQPDIVWLFRVQEIEKRPLARRVGQVPAVVEAELSDFDVALPQVVGEESDANKDFPAAPASTEGSSRRAELLVETAGGGVGGIENAAPCGAVQGLELGVCLRGRINGSVIIIANFEERALAEEVTRGVHKAGLVEVAPELRKVLGKVEQVVSAGLSLSDRGPLLLAPCEALPAKVNDQAEAFHERSWKEEGSAAGKNMDMEVSCSACEVHRDDRGKIALESCVVAETEHPVARVVAWSPLDAMELQVRSRVTCPTTKLWAPPSGQLPERVRRPGGRPR